MSSLCIKRIESTQRIRLTIEEGARQSLHAGASSRILLAYQPEAYIKKWIASNPLLGFTPNTICNAKDLLETLKLTRKQGYTHSDSEVDAGSVAVAAPIFGPGEKLAAGLSLAGPKDRMHERVVANLITLLVKVAERISRKLRM